MSITRVKVREPKVVEEEPKVESDPVDDSPSDPAPEAAPTEKPEKPDDKAKKPVERLSAPLREIRTAEDTALRDWLDEIGPQGSYKISLSRSQPKSVRDPRTGREVITKGHLYTYEDKIDEDLIQREWGGGTYNLKIMKRTAKGFQYQEGFHRTIDIAGDPDLTRLPGNPVPPAVAPAGGESASVVKQVFDVMKGELDRKDAQQGPRGMDPAITLMLEQNARREEARDREAARREEAHDRELAAMRAELAAARNQKPEADPIKDKMLSSLLDGQSGHVTALQLRQEAELRQVKAAAVEDMKRVEDRHDRTVQEMRQSHELALASLKGSFEREISAIRQSHEVALASAKASHDVQVRTLQADVARLERDNGKMSKEVDDLRAKKDKPLAEQVKEIHALKEMLGDGEGGSAWDKIAEIATSPGIIEGIGKFVGGGPAAAAKAAPVAAPARAAFMRNPKTKQVFANTPEGLVPLKPKPKVVQQEDGSSLELPVIDEELAAQIGRVIGLMEMAFNGNQDAVIVAQSARASIPPEILTWIQQHDSEQVSGVDLFLQKVAKLPGTSPLANSMRGRNWVRALGKALING